MKELIIVIPVYNEDKNIEHLIQQWIKVLPESKMDILFIDDGSEDKSSDILDEYVLTHKNILLIKKKNSGHGDTILIGYNYAIKNQYRLVMQIDSDNQFSSDDFKTFWLLRNNDYDLIIGNRKKRNDPFLRVFLSKVLLRSFIYLLFFKKTYDANIPYRLIKIKALENYLNHLKFVPIAPNLLMTIYMNKIKVVNVSHFKRKYGDISWPILKLINFSKKLFLEIITFKKK